MPTIIPIGIIDFDNIKSKLTEDLGSPSNCTSPAGHCFGSDGGTGIPPELKVAPGQGGSTQVWVLNPSKTAVLQKLIYEKCQYCGKYHFSQEYKEPTEEELRG